MACPMCARGSKGRPAKRFCPAKGEMICAVCCGQGREVTIDCPADCPHLLAAHRYDFERRPPRLPGREVPYPDLNIPPEFIYERWGVLSTVAGSILRLQDQRKELKDSDAIAALEALAETHRTLEAGIIYGARPAQALAGELYDEIAGALRELRKQEAERGGFGSLMKDADLFRIFVFLLRMARAEGSARPLSRAFLGYLRDRIPPAVTGGREEPRIIVP